MKFYYRFISCLVFGICIVAHPGIVKAGWYTVSIIQIVPRDGGDTFVQFESITGAFSGIARGTVVGSNDGANKIVAVLLTALALDKDVSLCMDGEPSWDIPENITSAGIVANSEDAEKIDQYREKFPESY